MVHHFFVPHLPKLLHKFHVALSLLFRRQELLLVLCVRHLPEHSELLLFHFLPWNGHLRFLPTMTLPIMLYVPPCTLLILPRLIKLLTGHHLDLLVNEVVVDNVFIGLLSASQVLILNI